MLRLILSSVMILTPMAVLARDAVPSSAMGPWQTSVTIAKKTAAPVTTGSLPRHASHTLTGIASYYWQGQMTASGERFDKTQMTAAHKTLPMGTRVRVRHMGNGKSVVVRINDRGPFKPGRVIDLSEAAAKQIEMTGQGLATVALEVVH